MKLKYYLRGLGSGIIFTAIVLAVSFALHGEKKISDAEIIQRAKELGMVEDGNAPYGTEAVPVTETEENTDTENTEATTGTSGNTSVDSKTQEKDEKSSEAEKGEEVSANKKDAEKKEASETEKSSEKKESSETEKSSEKKESSETEKSSEKKESSKEEKETEAKSDNTEKNSTNVSKENETDNKYVSITIRSGQVCRDIAENLKKKGLVDDAEAFRKYMGQKGYANKIRCGTFKIPVGADFDEIAKCLTR